MLITLCGGEGAGKSTQVKRLSEALKGRGFSVVCTREPGGTAIGRKIRALLLDPENREMTGETELFLYAADRCQHLGEVVRPALAAGRIVISDRFADSTTVYQGVARGLDPRRIRNVHALVLEGLKPDITFLLDLPPEKGLARALAEVGTGGRPGDETRFEKESLVFHQKIREGFLALAVEEKDRFCLLDALEPVETLTQKMLEICLALLEKKKKERP